MQNFQKIAECILNRRMYIYHSGIFSSLVKLDFVLIDEYFIAYQYLPSLCFLSSEIGYLTSTNTIRMPPVTHAITKYNLVGTLEQLLTKFLDLTIYYLYGKSEHKNRLSKNQKIQNFHYFRSGKLKECCKLYTMVLSISSR